MTVFLVYTFREPELLARAVRALRPHPFVVHVDAKVAIEPFSRALDPADRDRVTLLQDRVQVNWAGYSQVEAIRKLVRAGITRARADEYLVLLSGQDYPIQPVAALDEHFRRLAGTQFIRFFDIAHSTPAYASHVNRRHHRDLGFLSTRTLEPRLRKIRNGTIRLIDRFRALSPAPTAPSGFVLAHGTTHFAMTAEFAQMLEDAVTPEIDEFFHTVFCPEEKFYHSLVANSSRVGETSSGGIEPFVGSVNTLYQNLHHIHPSLTKVYTEADWAEVSTSSQFFLRKLESERSATLLDRIDRELLHLPQ